MCNRLQFHVILLIASLFLSVLTNVDAGASDDNDNLNNGQLDLLDLSAYDDHVRCISDVTCTPMTVWVTGDDGASIASKSVLGSDFIPVCTEDYISILCGTSADSSNIQYGEFYVYFYDTNKKILWDILDHTNEKTGEKNRFSFDELRLMNGFQFYGLPEHTFIRVAPANGFSCKVFLWDGEGVGYPLTGLATAFNGQGDKERLSPDAYAGIQVPKTALYLIAKPEYTFVNMYNSTTFGSFATPVSASRFPSQIVCLKDNNGDNFHKNISVVKGYDYHTRTYEAVLPNTDLSQYIIAIDELDYRPEFSTQDVASFVYDRIQDCMNFEWEAKATITDNNSQNTSNGMVGFFREGMTYHGIPYRNQWTTASSVGWHVTKQTFMNAANDPDSIFYNNDSTPRVGPYYSLVCSSFGTLVTGFAYPMTNYSLMNEPQIHVWNTTQLPLGTLLSNGIGHCVIPYIYSTAPSGETVLTIAEQVTPTTTLRNIFPDVERNWKGIGLYSSYLDNYIYACSPTYFADIPYDISVYTIKNGSARPYRGDQSVYTSDMDVLINIKSPSATRLYFQKIRAQCDHGIIKSIDPIAPPQFMEIPVETSQWILRTRSKADGTYDGADLESGSIYAVWASEDGEQTTMPANAEFFEWYDLDKEKITYSVSDGTLITDDFFWYTWTSTYSFEEQCEDKQYGNLTIPYQPPSIDPNDESPAHSDYSNYAAYARILSDESVRAFFRKGQLGAYVTGKEACTLH